MLDKLFAAISKFAYGELTRHIQDEKAAAAARRDRIREKIRAVEPVVSGR